MGINTECPLFWQKNNWQSNIILLAQNIKYSCLQIRNELNAGLVNIPKFKFWLMDLKRDAARILGFYTKIIHS